MNIVCLIGNITRDIELRYTASGMAVATVSIAVNKQVKEKKTVSYFEVVLWGKTAENCSTYLTKGSKISVTGELEQQRWEKDGKKNSKVVINANRIGFLSPKKEVPAGEENMNADNIENLEEAI
jgi:single-strand DNA-binding protein